MHPGLVASSWQAHTHTHALRANLESQMLNMHVFGQAEETQGETNAYNRQILHILFSNYLMVTTRLIVRIKEHCEYKVF